MAESLCCPPEIITTLLIGYSSIENSFVLFFFQYSPGELHMKEFSGIYYWSKYQTSPGNKTEVQRILFSTSISGLLSE